MYPHREKVFLMWIKKLDFNENKGELEVKMCGDFFV